MILIKDHSNIMALFHLPSLIKVNSIDRRVDHNAPVRQIVAGHPTPAAGINGNTGRGLETLQPVCMSVVNRAASAAWRAK